MDIQRVVKMYNEEHKKLDDIAKELNYSKGTISKALSADGYVLNRKLKKYLKETVNTGNNKEVNNVSRETINTANNKKVKTVKCTFDIPEKLHREIKSKCALNGVKMVDFIRDVLEKAIKEYK